MLRVFVQKFRNNPLIKNSTIFFLGSITVSIGNYIYHLVLGRILGPEDYGILASLISISIILSIPTATISLISTKLASNAKVKKNYGQLHFLIRYLLKRLGLASIIFILIFSLLSPAIAAFLKIPTPNLVIMIGLSMVFAFLIPVTEGTLKGLQLFKPLAINMSILPVVKTGLGIILVLMGFQIYGALGGFLAANIAVFAFSFIPLRFLFKYKRKKRIKINHIFRYSIPVLAALFCFTLLYNLDIILVKHFFNEQDAGLYSALSKLGQIIFFGTGAIATVLFPMVSEKYKKGENTNHLLWQSLKIVSLASGFGVLLFFIFPKFFMSLLFGAAYLSVSPLVGLFALAMLFLALNNVFINFFLSIHKYKFIYIISFATILEITLIIFLHSSIKQIVYNILFSLILLFVGLVFIFFLENKIKKPKRA